MPTAAPEAPITTKNITEQRSQAVAEAVLRQSVKESPSSKVAQELQRVATKEPRQALFSMRDYDPNQARNGKQILQEAMPQEVDDKGQSKERSTEQQERYDKASNAIKIVEDYLQNPEGEPNSEMLDAIQSVIYDWEEGKELYLKLGGAGKERTPEQIKMLTDILQDRAFLDKFKDIYTKVKASAPKEDGTIATLQEKKQKATETSEALKKNMDLLQEREGKIDQELDRYKNGKDGSESLDDEVRKTTEKLDTLKNTIATEQIKISDATTRIELLQNSIQSLQRKEPDNTDKIRELIDQLKDTQDEKVRAIAAKRAAEIQIERKQELETKKQQLEKDKLEVAMQKNALHVQVEEAKRELYRAQASLEQARLSRPDVEKAIVDNFASIAREAAKAYLNDKIVQKETEMDALLANVEKNAGNAAVGVITREMRIRWGTMKNGKLQPNKEKILQDFAVLTETQDPSMVAISILKDHVDEVPELKLFLQDKGIDLSTLKGEFATEKDKKEAESKAQRAIKEWYDKNPQIKETKIGEEKLEYKLAETLLKKRLHAGKNGKEERLSSAEGRQLLDMDRRLIETAVQSKEITRDLDRKLKEAGITGGLIEWASVSNMLPWLLALLLGSNFLLKATGNPHLPI